MFTFGEILKFWSNGRVTATPHRVVGGSAERIWLPMFFDPTYHTYNVPIQRAKRCARNFGR